MALYQLNQETHTYVKSLMFNINAFSAIMVSRCFSEINTLPSILLTNCFVRSLQKAITMADVTVWCCVDIDSIP